MRIDFNPQLQIQRTWVAAAVGVGSLAYGIIKGTKAKKEQKKMEAMANAAKANPSITDYYQKALARANKDPYQSQFYNQQKQGVDRNLATGINSLQNRRSAVGGISALLQQSNDAMGKAGVVAEDQKNREFSQLGQAAGVKTQEDRYPFELKYNLMGMKAGGYNEAANAGFQSALNAAGSVGAQTQYKKLSRSGSSGGYSSGGNYIGE